MDLNTFMKHLHTYRAPRVFNPWREYEPGLDIGPSAPEIRYHNLQRYLELRLNAHYLFIAARKCGPKKCWVSGTISAPAIRIPLC